MPRIAKLMASSVAPTSTSRRLGSVRPRPIEARRNPPGMSSAATATPLRAVPRRGRVRHVRTRVAALADLIETAERALALSSDDEAVDDTDEAAVAHHS